MMNSIYSRSEDSSTLFNKGLLAFIITVTIFSLLPILQIIPNMWTSKNPLKGITTYTEDPPLVIEQIPEKPKEKLEVKKPEIEKPLPLPTLAQIEAQFVVGDGLGGYQEAIYTGFISAKEDLEIFDLKDLEKEPKALFQVEPAFPYHLKNQGIEGWVLIEWVITDRGRVSQIKAIQYSHREFVGPAIDSISKSKWSPGEISSKPVNSRVRQKITFNL